MHLPCLLLGLLLTATPARAQEARPDELSLGAATFTYGSFLRGSSIFTVAEGAWRRPVKAEGFWRHVWIGGGLRGGPVTERDNVTVPLEAFLQARFTASIGPWQPAVGPELGVSGFARLFHRPISAEGEDELEQARLTPVYLALGAAPLRFRFSRFTVSALEFHVGTGAFPRSSAVRLHLGLLSAGVSL